MTWPREHILLAGFHRLYHWGDLPVPKVRADRGVRGASPLTCTFQRKVAWRLLFLSKEKFSGTNLHWQRNKNYTCFTQIPGYSHPTPEFYY